MAAPLVRLNNGFTCPSFGLGTVAQKIISADMIKFAISKGYRYIDTAWVYGNEQQVGKGINAAIADNICKREDIFVVTKLWNIFHDRERVVPACKESLSNLGLHYIDLYLIHWPVAQRKTDKFNGENLFTDGVERYEHDVTDTWRGMEDCVELGLTRSIGVSNFDQDGITHLLKSAIIYPVMNQIRVNPFQNQKELIAFCKKKEIQVTAYSPLTSPGNPWKPKELPDLCFDDPRLIAIGKKYGKTGSQVCLRYLLDIGTIPIPKSDNPERIQQNINVFDFKLSPEDIKVMDTFNRLESGVDTSMLA